MKTAYALSIGSNVRHGRFGTPEKVLEAAFDALDGKATKLIGRSGIVSSAPLGPSKRRYANAAAIVETKLSPPELLKKLKKTERKFGRQSRGARWSARVLDLDIALWSGGFWASPELTVPHREFRQRPFVLGPLLKVASDWRDPLTGLSVRHLKARLDRKRPAA